MKKAGKFRKVLRKFYDVKYFFEILKTILIYFCWIMLVELT